MKTRHEHYNYVATLPERSINHPFAKLVAIFDTKRGEFFTANTCDVHERLAPWEGGADSQYTDDEVHERLVMMRAGGLLP
jgi:predicted GIY-YIG superfamily endonuclease